MQDKPGFWTRAVAANRSRRLFCHAWHLACLFNVLLILAESGSSLSISKNHGKVDRYQPSGRPNSLDWEVDSIGAEANTGIGVSLVVKADVIPIRAEKRSMVYYKMLLEPPLRKIPLTSNSDLLMDYLPGQRFLASLNRLGSQLGQFFAGSRLDDDLNGKEAGDNGNNDAFTDAGIRKGLGVTYPPLSRITQQMEQSLRMYGCANGRTTQHEACPDYANSLLLYQGYLPLQRRTMSNFNRLARVMKRAPIPYCLVAGPAAHEVLYKHNSLHTQFVSNGRIKRILNVVMGSTVFKEEIKRQAVVEKMKKQVEKKLRRILNMIMSKHPIDPNDIVMGSEFLG